MATITHIQAAQRLGISAMAVSKHVGTGRLVRVGEPGRNSLIDSDSVERFALSGGGLGRPWNERTAWAALTLLSGGKVGPNWISSSSKSKLKRRLRQLDANAIQLLARKHAVTTRYVARTEDVEQICTHLVLSGAAAMRNTERSTAFGINYPSNQAEGYLTVDDVEEFLHHFELEESPGGNVTIRRTTRNALRMQPLVDAVVAVDLMDSLVPAEREAGTRAVANMVRTMDS